MISNVTVMSGATFLYKIKL